MQTALTLLSAALDSTGYIAIRGFGVGASKDKQPRQKFFAPGDYAGACNEAMRLSNAGYDTYFATSTFLSNKSAEAVNVNAVKCFKIDLDVEEGNENKYGTKKDAVAALAEFCTQFGLPVPVLVDSGFGVHGYWCLTEALNADDGKLYSEKLKALFLAHGLKHDRTVTGDIARVLRVPETLNNKQSVARRVKLKSAVTLIDTDTMLDVIDALYASTPDLPAIAAQPTALLLGALPAHLRGLQLDKETLGLITGKPKSFAVLIKRSISSDKGCAQINDIYDKQGKQTEDRWRAGLSIAHFCDDGETAIHDMSNRYPKYTPEETIKKASLVKGPYKCSTFEASWPEHCRDCPNKGKITSPIQLGDYVPLADKKDNIVLAQNKSVDDGLVTYTIPEYPWPYVRGRDGGVYRREAEDEDNPSLVHKFDLYVVDRLRDEADGYLLQLRHHHPTDGVLDFTVKASVVARKDAFMEALSSFGIMKFDKEVTVVREYVRTWVNQMEMQKEVNKVRTQFGWTEGYKSFVIGDRELTAHGKTYSRTAPSMASATKAMTKQGDYNEWRKVFNVYATKGFEPHAFCALVGFGSPLMPLLDLSGALINAFSQDSGTGKSTTLQAAESIWGSPDGLILTCGKGDGDTALARFNRMGWYKNLPICVDEVTKLSEDEMSSLLLSSTSGRGRHRMAASSNTERINNTTWSALTLTSANKTFVEALQADKVGVDGELMRLLEVHLPPNDILTKEQADSIFGGLKHHFGFAGEIYVQHMMQNWSRVKPMLEDERRRIDTAAQCTKKERFWSAACACVITGARLAQECGLHDIDVDAVREFAVQLIVKTRARINYTGAKEHRSDLLGEFMNMHIANSFVVQVGMLNDKPTYTALQLPTRDLCLRYERNVGKMFVAQTVLNKYMRERNVHIEQHLAELRAANVFVGTVQKRLGAGLPTPGNPVRAYEFNIKDEEIPPFGS